MAIPSAVIEEIKYRNDIETVVSSYITLKRAGKNLVGLCPFHGEKTPSFTVFPENGSFYCFGCKVGGDVFTFVKNIENLDYIETVRLLAERCGVTIPESGYDDSMAKLRNRIFEINRETARFYNAYLENSGGKWAVDYYSERGLTPQTVRNFGLGAAPDSWDSLRNHLRSKGYTEDEMLQANVVTRSKNGGCYDRFRNRAMFPIINVRGNVIGFSGRRREGLTDKEAAKYINTSDTPVYKKSQNLFGINYAKSHCSESLILVEGNLDVISLHQAGFKNTVCPLGTAFTSEQANLITRYTKEVIICFDADTAGQTAVSKAIDIFAPTGISVKVVLLPEGKDPDEFLKNNSPAKFQKLIDGAVSATEYKLLKAAGGLDLNSDNARITYLNNAAEILAKSTDPIAVDYYIPRLAEKYGVSKEAIRDKVNELKRKNAYQKQKKEIKAMADPTFDRNDVNPDRRGNERAAKAEETVISILFKHPDLIPFTRERIGRENFVSGLNKRLLDIVFELYDNNQSFDFSVIAQSFTDKEIGYVSSLLNSGYNDNNPKNALLESFKALSNAKLYSEKPETTDDWAALLTKITENKKGNN